VYLLYFLIAIKQLFDDKKLSFTHILELLSRSKYAITKKKIKYRMCARDNTLMQTTYFLSRFYHDILNYICNKIIATTDDLLIVQFISSTFSFYSTSGSVNSTFTKIILSNCFNI